MPPRIKPIFLRRYPACLALLCILAPLAAAHGDRPHAKTAAQAAGQVATREQKPFGIAADENVAHRTIRIEMDDSMRFIPNRITVAEGETVRFLVVNRGKAMHEMVIGTEDELRSHAEMMKKYPDMEHDEPHMAHVSPGRQEVLTWTFNRPGHFRFACLVAGHFEAGMTGDIHVKPASSWP